MCLCIMEWTKPEVMEYLKSKWKELGYNYEGRLIESMQEIMKANNVLDYQIVFIGKKPGSPKGRASYAEGQIKLYFDINKDPETEIFETFLHELAHVVTYKNKNRSNVTYYYKKVWGYNYTSGKYEQQEKKIARFDHHGRAWIENSRRLGAIPKRSWWKWKPPTYKNTNYRSTGMVSAVNVKEVSMDNSNKIHCPCGGNYNKKYRWQHFATKQHKTYENSKN